MGLKISIDTNVFLNVKSKEAPYYKHSKKILQLIDHGEIEGVVPTIVVAEICAGYHQFKQLEEKDEFLAQLTTNPNYRLVSLDLKVADEAGRIEPLRLFVFQTRSS